MANKAKLENLTKGQMGKMEQKDLIAHIEKAQQAILKAEKDKDYTGLQMEEGQQRYTMLLQVKNAVKSGIMYIWSGTKKVYVTTKDFLVNLFRRIKGFLATTWVWLQGIARVCIDTVVSAFKAFGVFLGRILARAAKGAHEVFDKVVRVFIPSEEDDNEAMVRKLSRPDLEKRAEEATEKLEAEAEAAAA